MPSSQAQKTGIVFCGALAALNLIAYVLMYFVDGQSPYFARLEPSLKTIGLKRFVQATGPISIAAIGSSIADMGFDVMVLDSRLASRGVRSQSYNFGINGAGPVVFYELLSRVIVPVARPRVVIYGLSPIEFNASSRIFREDQAKFMVSAGLSRSREGANLTSVTRSLLFDALPLYQLGEVYWPNLFLTAGEQTWLTTKNFKAEFQGQQRVPGQWIRDAQPNWPEWANARYRDLLLNYQVSSEAMESLGAIAKNGAQIGVKVIWVNMPELATDAALTRTVFEEIRNSNPTTTIRIMFNAALQEKMKELGANYLDLHDYPDFGEADFGDPYHLNGSGARKLAEILAPYVAGVLCSENASSCS